MATVAHDVLTGLGLLSLLGAFVAYLTSSSMEEEANHWAGSAASGREYSPSKAAHYQDAEFLGKVSIGLLLVAVAFIVVPAAVH